VSAIASRLEAAGMTPAAAAAKQDLFDRVNTAIDANVPKSVIRYAWFVPGRIEVLGKHTDYAGGRSVLSAVERGICAVASPRDDACVVVTDIGRQVSATVALDPELAVPSSGWANYVGTVTRRVARNFPISRRGADIVFTSDLPSSSGMSSSSALITSIFLALADINALEETPEGNTLFRRCQDLATYVSTVENGQSFGELAGDRGVGTTGGSEDHTAILCARADRLSQYAFCPVRLEHTMELDPAWVFAIGVSGVSANKTGSAREQYNAAATATRRMLEIWRAATGRADAVLADALASAPDAADRLRQLIRADTDGNVGRALLDRFDQFLEESEHIIPSAMERLAARDVAGFGALVDRSQALAERLLGNQIPETIGLAASARSHGAVAASAFGAGFGGSVWALIPTEEATAFIDRWSRSYRAAFPHIGQGAIFFTSRPGPAAIRVT
jgi:galactokinase